MASPPLVGTWRLVSWQVVVDGVPRDLFGSRPKGWLILAPEGGAMALTTAGDRAPGEGEAERAALQGSMLAWTGRYRIEDERFATTVDAPWNEARNRTEQWRNFRTEGDRLSIRSEPAPSTYPSAASTTG